MMMMLVQAHPGLPPQVESAGIFHGTLIKRDNRWLVYRWRVKTDRANDPFMGEGDRFDGPVWGGAAQ